MGLLNWKTEQKINPNLLLNEDRTMRNQEIFSGNQSYIQGESPEYFHELAKGQSPDYVWIGCCDSRVPPEMITNQSPGKLFVYRNIANQCRLDDNHMIKGIQFATEVLGAKKIIVCGHSNCGGVAAAMSDQTFGLDNVIEPVQKLYRENYKELSAIEDQGERVVALAKLNALQQVKNIRSFSFIGQQNIEVCPLIYYIESGQLSVVNE